MPRPLVLPSMLRSALAMVIVTGAVALPPLQVNLSAQGIGGSPEAKAKQLAFEATIPELKVTEEILPLVVPGHTIGETEGVSKNSKGHLFVYSRTGTSGISRGGTAAELFEFDQNLKFVKLWGPGNYAASFAHSVRVDKYDNVWMVDEGSGMIVKFDPNANVKMTLGRKPEAIDYVERYMERGQKETDLHPVGVMGSFNRETDIAWDPDDNMYISDGYGNSRIVKLNKNGDWIKVLGTHGSGENQFSTPHSIAYADGKIYVGDRGNFRIQVYDTDFNFKKSIPNIGAPWGVCVSPAAAGKPQYLFSGDGTTGKIYKMDLDGKILGWGQTGLHQGQTGCLIHEIHCESDTVVYRGACGLWNVEKITIK
jgi:hypothetical protein